MELCMIHVVARSAAVGTEFLLRHPTLASQITVELGQRSYFEMLNHLIEEGEAPHACVIHDDVVLPSSFAERVDSLLQELDRNWPNWGLVGNAAVLTAGVGYAGARAVRYLSDPHGGPNLARHILPAQTIDGNVMLLNLKAMRAKGLRLPDFDGFQLYDIVMSIEAISAGLGVLVAPHLACWHGSKGSQASFDRAASGEAFGRFCSNRLRNRSITTLNGLVKIGLDAENPMLSTGIDLQIDSLRTADQGRPAKTVAIVTRTQFRRPALLNRTLDTIAALLAAAGAGAQYRSYVVTDADEEVPESVSQRATVMRTDFRQGVDSRYRLVRFAAERIEADYFWFIDDDDWVFPNEAERLGLVVNTAPENSIVFVGSQHFEEASLARGPNASFETYRSKPARRFAAKDFLASLSGENHSPFCGVLLSRAALLNISLAVYESVTYFEDYMTTLSALLEQDCFPITVDKLFVGISLRRSGNSVTEKDRRTWNRSMSELVSHLVNSSDCSQMLSLPPQAWGRPPADGSGDLTVRGLARHSKRLVGKAIRRVKAVTR